jgi:hypothetical protein
MIEDKLTNRAAAEIPVAALFTFYRTIICFLGICRLKLRKNISEHKK